MDSQKLEAKKYSFLNGNVIAVYIGRVPSKLKHVEEELSLVKKTNEYGEYQAIDIKINKTHYNGKKLTIEPKYLNRGTVVRSFEINNDQIINLL